MTADGPHADVNIVRAGAPLEEATAVAIALHGRGATARSILQLVAHADPTDDAVAYLAPQAAGSTWYPRSFLAPVEANEPFLTSALDTVGRTLSRATDAVDPDRVVLIGFSQGACLASEYVARHPARYGGLFAFSGGLIGDAVAPDRYDGSLAGTTVYLGCSDVDPHIPEERVHETAEVFDRLDASVTTAIFEGMGHTVNDAEIDRLRKHLGAIVETR